MTYPLGSNRYGKIGVHLATVARDADRHTFTDIEVEVLLQGDFAPAHVDGVNADVLPTDTMRGTCTALARDGVDPVADYARRVAERLLEASPAARSVALEVVTTPWERLEVDGVGHDHAFRPAAGGQQVLWFSLERDGEGPVVEGGVRGLKVLKSTGSAFSGYPTDRYTTLPETRDRIMASTVEARWGTRDAAVDHAALAHAVPATFCARFATHDESESLQHTLHAMGSAVLEAHPEVTWIHFRMPNEHHNTADLAPYGLDNPNVVFVVAGPPSGLIEGTVHRPGVEVPARW
ncbi:MAG: urate oxidase [Nitriliruptoraceae bacterium]|nr:urate oxidase [Nitriliruptoraceae bacterium]